jgi:hypothetical protein
MQPRGIRFRRRWIGASALILGLAGGCGRCLAQTDEIQVFTGAIAGPGELTLTSHSNYTPEGLSEPAFPGAFAPEHTLNGSAEWSYGTTDWLELGAHFPVYSATPGGHVYLEGLKLRALFVVPHAESLRFFYGVNFEYSANAARWQFTRDDGEIRPIVGVRFGAWDFITNPIVDTNFRGGVAKLDFAPATRIAYNLSPRWTFAVENYADLGPLDHFAPLRREEQQLFLVVDYNGKTDVEFGVGHGLNGATDQVVVKLMLTWSLHRPAGAPLHRREMLRRRDLPRPDGEQRSQVSD